MKIRNGFVSNSSSSSFVCDVCGSAESGMDACASDFDMSNCCNGHTFCNSHAGDLEDPTPQQIRANITSQINNCSWRKAEDKAERLKELAEVEDDDIEDFYDDNYSDNGVPESQCPICSMTVLRDLDGFFYLKRKLGVTDDNILSEIKADFKSYTEFRDIIYKKK